MSGRHTNMQQHIGKTYNYLLVDEIITDVYKYKNKEIKKTYFKCICKCGKLKNILAGNILNNSIKSCGCMKKELINKACKLLYDDNKNQSVEKRMFSSYKKHGKEFLLTFEEFNKFIIKKCYYCNDDPNIKRFSKNKQLSLELNGIDRINSFLGYTKDNCVTCCTKCNIMKNTLSIDEFYKHIDKIYKNLELKNKILNEKD